MVRIIFFMWPSCTASTLGCRREGWRWRRWRGSRRTSCWEGWCLLRWPARRGSVPGGETFYINQLVICVKHTLNLPEEARQLQVGGDVGCDHQTSQKQEENCRSNPEFHLQQNVSHVHLNQTNIDPLAVDVPIYQFWQDYSSVNAPHYWKVNGKSCNQDPVAQECSKNSPKACAENCPRKSFWYKTCDPEPSAPPGRGVW